MRTHIRFCAAVGCISAFLAGAGFAQSQQNAPPAFILDNPGAGIPGRFTFKTEPGIRYDLWESLNLTNWNHVTGFPKVADALSLDYSYLPIGKKFFRVQPIDEQPPTVVEQYPAANGFAVRRFDDLLVRLADASAMDPASIRLTVGSTGPLALGTPGLSFANNAVTYDSGDAALGSYGQNVTATLVAADVLGHVLTHTWSFNLEPQPLLAANIFVFGAPTAQRAGQEVNGPAAALAARFANGPIRMNANAAPWSIASVLPDSIVIVYTGATPPVFTQGQLICNLCPTKAAEIFYRRVTAVTNDSAASRLTLMTIEAPLTEFVSDGSAAFSNDSVVYETRADGTLVRALSVSGTKAFPRVGFDLSGTTFKLRPDGFSVKVGDFTASVGSQPDILSAEAREWSFWLTPILRAGLELEGAKLKNYEAIATATVSTAQVMQVDLTLTGVKGKVTLFDLPENLEPKYVVFFCCIGVLPVYATLSFDFKFKAEAEVYSLLQFEAGFRQDVAASFGLTYGETDGFQSVRSFQASSPDIVRPQFGVGAEFKFRASAEPTLEFLVYGLAGFDAGFFPYAEAEATYSSLTGITGATRVGLDFEIGTSGPAFDFLGIDNYLRADVWHRELTWSTQPLVFDSQPSSVTAAPGSDVSFTATVRSPEPPSFQWHHQGHPIPGETNRTLFLPRVTSGHAGSYFVRAMAGATTLDSQTATLTITSPTPQNIDTDGDGLTDAVETNTGIWLDGTHRGTNPYRWDSDGDGLSDAVETNTGVYVSPSNTGTNPNRADSDADGIPDGREVFLGTNPGGGTVPSGFVLIPAGSFQMGNSINASEGDSDELPVHTVTVSAFYMGTTEVTKSQWDAAYSYGTTNGYAFDNPGQGKAANHPVHTVSWYDVVKWCNAKSQQDGLTPCYTVSGAIYKTGQQSGVVCDFTRNGYRLPTEAEWEKAARGGLSATRFPWGDTITHSLANYLSSSSYSYDISPTPDYHPTYNDGIYPYTSPVGAFAANGYGLYDMSGNVWEWCWDRYGSSYYISSPATDPTGAASGSYRVVRGGSWGGLAGHARVAFRGYVTINYDYVVGFRLARGRL